jgi:outer membrane lipoprotein-sorting protein
MREERTRRHRQRDRTREGSAGLAAALLLTCLFACAGTDAPAPDLVAAAIEARGGPLEGFTRRSELDVHYGFPGSWSWELMFLRPDRFRLTLHTTGEDQSFASDGKTLRTYLGSAPVGEEPAHGACTTSLARWLAVVTLDELSGPAFHWRELARDQLPKGAARGLEVRCAAQPESRYRLFVDRALRLVAVSGPITLPVLGDGRLEARFSDFRSVGGLRLAFRIDYELDGQPFLEESVVAYERAAGLAAADPHGPQRDSGASASVLTTRTGNGRSASRCTSRCGKAMVMPASRKRWSIR